MERLGLLTRVGLRLPVDTSADEYEALGFALGEMHRAVQFAVGDYILDGEKLFGQEAYQLQESLGISEEQRRQYVRIAERIPWERRRKELSWAHHREVAAMEPSDQDAWLEKAVANAWSKNELVAYLRPNGLPPEPKGVTCPECGKWIPL
jgi:hypothetical protein